MRTTWSSHKLIALVFVAAFGGTVLAACGGGTSTSATSTVASPTSVAAPSTAVPANGSATVRATEGQGDPRTAWTFDPAQISVRAGDSVTFVNAGNEAHTATADDGSFDAGTLNPGDSKSVKFDREGSFKFHCSLHPWMTGTVVVSAAASGSDGNGSSY